MCVSVGPSRMSSTILYGRVLADGTHVLGYQNTARNRSGKPNAMILPLPAREPLGPENIVDVSTCKDVLKDYRDAVQMRSLGGSGMKSLTLGSRGMGAVQVFKSGKYTVVSAQDPRLIPDALAALPENIRPPLNSALFESLATLYPDWPVAVCCFNEDVGGEPLVWSYRPKDKDKDKFFFPALDAHDGGAPNLQESVSVDHTIVYGAEEGRSVHFTQNTPPALRQHFPPYAVGVNLEGTYPNGDFVAAVKNGKLRVPARVPPPGA